MWKFLKNRLNNLFRIILILLFSLNLSNYSEKEYFFKSRVDLDNISATDEWDSFKNLNWPNDNKIIFSSDTGIYSFDNNSLKIDKLVSSNKFHNNPNFIDNNRIVFITKEDSNYRLNSYSLKTKKMKIHLKNTCDYYLSANNTLITAITDQGIKNINTQNYDVKNVTNFVIKPDFKLIGCSIAFNEKNNDVYFVGKSKNSRSVDSPGIYKICKNCKSPVEFYKITDDSSDYSFKYLNFSPNYLNLSFIHSVGISYLNIFPYKTNKPKIVAGGEINGNPKIHSILDKPLWTKDSKNILFVGEFYQSDVLSTKLFSLNTSNHKITEIKNTENIRKPVISSDEKKLAFFQKENNHWYLVIKNFNF